MSGEVCVHGSLARQCYSCELLAEVAELKAEIKRLRAFVATFDIWIFGDSGPSKEWDDKCRKLIAMRAAIDAKAVDGET